MTSWQKRVIGILVIINGAVIAALILAIMRFSDSASSAHLASPVPTYASGALSREQCERRAVQRLSEAGLAGRVTLIPGGSLRLDLVDPLAESRNSEEAAQLVWRAFDIVATLTEERCDVFARVEVGIETQDSESSTQIQASVATAHLKAFYDGGLSESEFIDQVQYAIESTDDR